MYKRYFLCFALTCLVVAGYAPDASAKKKSKSNIKLLEAYSQRTLPGIPGARTMTDYYFIIKWEGAKYPETFFWRGDNGWMTCNITKAHKTENKGNDPEAVDYRAEQVSIGAIHKGDTLQLKPIAGGKFPIPAEIPADAKNTLYYKTGGSGWLSFPVKEIGKKRDIARQ